MRIFQIILILCGVTCLPLRPAVAQSETWTSKNGHTFQGTYVSSTSRQVTLRGTDGKLVQVPMAALAPSAIELVKRYQFGSDGDLPLFVHENTHYRYAIYPKANWLAFTFLNNGSPKTPDPLQLRVSLAETKGRRKRIPIEEMVGDPVEEGGSVVVRFRMANGVIVRLSVETSTSDSIEFRQEIESVPSKVTSSLSLGNSLSMPTLLEYDTSSRAYKGPYSSTPIPFPELEDMFAPYTLRYETRNGESQESTYDDKKGFTAKELSIRHPEWPEFHLESKDQGNLNIYLYGGKQFFTGYGIRFRSVNSENPMERAEFSLSME